MEAAGGWYKAVSSDWQAGDAALGAARRNSWGASSSAKKDGVIQSRGRH